MLSNGRLIFGVGAGWWAEEFAMLGVPFEHRGSRLGEYIQLLKALWTEQNPSFHGRFWQIEDVGFSPKPAQKPHPPIWIGGDGEAAFRRVGRLGDAWHAAFNRPEQLADKYARIQAYAREAGRDPRSVGLTVRTSAPTDTPQAIERLKAYAEAGVSHVALELWANSIDNFRAVVGRYAPGGAARGGVGRVKGEGSSKEAEGSGSETSARAHTTSRASHEASRRENVGRGTLDPGTHIPAGV